MRAINWLVVLAAFTVPTASFARGGGGGGDGVVVPADANFVNITQPPYSAVGDGVTDNTPAFQAALNALVGTSRVLYVPNGVYRFTGRLNWGGVRSGGFFVMQGQSQSGTILKLADGADGFGDPANPRVFLDAYEGNTANQFRNYLRDLTVDIGSNNPGATGVQFQASNTGRIENVTIRSSDPQKRGITGLDQGFNFPGPMLVRNVIIDGFDSGYIGAPQEYSVTMENITLLNQRVRGMGVYRLPLQIRNLVSRSSVRVFESFDNPGAWGHLVVDGADIIGLSGAQTQDAFVNVQNGGPMLLSNVRVTGYRYAVNDQTFSTTMPQLVPVGLVTQYTTDPVAMLNPSPTNLLNLPVEDAPDLPNPPLGQWVSVKAFGAVENDNLDDTAAVQAALKSGAAVVYFPSGQYVISDTLEIGPAVQRIEGYLCELYLNAPLLTENRPVFRIPKGAQPVVHIGGVQFSFQSIPPTYGGGVWIEQSTANTLVLRDGDLPGYRNTVPGGKVFLENVVGSAMVFKGQRVWARQLNPEGSNATHITNIGGDAYLLGVKTEGQSIVLENRARARTVVLGGLVYPATQVDDRTRPMVINDESSLSFSMPASCYANPLANYAVWIRETRGGVTLNLTPAMFPVPRGRGDCGSSINLYNGYVADSTPPTTPGGPTLISRTQTSVQFSWTPAADAETGIARYNVYRNGLLYGSVLPSDGTTLLDADLPDGTNFAYSISAVNGAGIESSRSLALDTSTVRDQTPPRITGIATGFDPRRVVLTFSEPLSAFQATTAANYSLTGPAGPVSVSSVVLSPDGLSATLTTQPLTPGRQSIALSNLSDRATIPNVVPLRARTDFDFSPAASGTGLTGQYYLNNSFTGTPVLTRVDPIINFDWTSSGPGAPLQQSNYAVRWTGQLQPRFNETYTISTISDDGSRVFIDGVLIVSNWFDQAPTERSGTIALDSSRTYDIVVEYYQGAGGSLMQLAWQSPSQPKQIIPQAYLFPSPRLRVVRTFDGAGADTTVESMGTTDLGTNNSMGVFHGPSGFHQAAYFRFDLAALNLADNYATDALITLSQTFFGVGDGRRQINLFAVKQAPAADNWVETGPGYVTWATASGNDFSGSIASPTASTWMTTYLLDNTSFRLNNQPDANPFRGSRIAEFVNADADGRVTFLAKRMDASNEGQSWFTKEWGIPGFAPALKVALSPRCPQVLAAPVAPVNIAAQSSLTLVARVNGAPPVTYQWLRDGNVVVDGPGPGGIAAGASGVISAASAQTSVSLSLSGLRKPASGTYTLRVSNACGITTSAGVSVLVCVADIDGNNQVEVADIFAFLSLWFASDARADIDGNSQVEVADIFAFLSAWFAGC